MEPHSTDSLSMDVDDWSILSSINHTIADYRRAQPYTVHLGASDNIPYPTTATSSSAPASDHGRGHPGDDTIDQAAVAFILDTNYLLSQLTFLRRLQETATQRPHVFIIVPWVVIRELDGLKEVGHGNRSRGSSRDDSLSSSRHESGNVGSLARSAIEFIYQGLQPPFDSAAAPSHGLAGRRRVLRGQKITECINVERTNDDLILDCCRYFAEARRIPSVVLLSLDKNLCVKAMVHQIGACGLWRDTPENLIGRFMPAEGFAPTHPLFGQPLAAATGADAAYQTSGQHYSFNDDDDDHMMMDADEPGDLDHHHQVPVAAQPLGTNPFVITATPSRTIPSTSVPTSQPFATPTTPNRAPTQPTNPITAFKHLSAIMDYLEDPDRSLLIHAVRFQCYQSLGNDYDYFIGSFRPSPWTLADLCEIVQRYWYSGFREALPSPAFPAFEGLKQLYHVYQELRVRGIDELAKATTTALTRSKSTGLCQITSADRLAHLRPADDLWKRSAPRLNRVPLNDLVAAVLTPSALRTLLDHLDAILILTDEVHRSLVRTPLKIDAGSIPSDTRQWLEVTLPAVFLSPDSPNRQHLMLSWRQQLLGPVEDNGE
ncbi:hypothetical protein IWQ60_001433 [Tieghemiomyces parasiticus]|uniref:PIN domain-containing protein n=1 Tax=Tieghemiomyces parasiticus TaxID=78921 RepID=A0A9W8AGP0_9FUNG|nr:hypothetical protein IWQ60_001433 [Tieghemiomyces parasiticus]